MEWDDASTDSLCPLHCLDIGSHCAISRDVKGNLPAELKFILEEDHSAEVDAFPFNRNE
jgi:hypothetical protein